MKAGKKEIMAAVRLSWISVAVVVAALLALPSAANALFGDDYGIAPVNSGGISQNSPALPGAESVPADPGGRKFAFWAGTCDRAAAPAPPSDPGDPPAAIPDGVGGIPATVEAAPSAENAPPYAVASPPTPEHCIDFGAVPALGGPLIWERTPGWRLPAVAKAGAHADGSATFWFNKVGSVVDGSVDNINVDLPPGFVGDPTAVPECTGEQFAQRPITCHPNTQVGVLRLFLTGFALNGANYPSASAHEEIVPIYNLEPRKGKTAEFGAAYVSGQTGAQGQGLVTARIVAKARTAGDYGVTSFIGQIPSALPLISQSVTLWGVPWEKANDVWRGPVDLGDQITGHPCKVQPGMAVGQPDHLPWSGLIPSCRIGYEPHWGSVKPFLSNETDCNPSPAVRLATDAFQRPGPFTADGDPLTDGHPSSSNWKIYTVANPTVTDCASLAFAADGSYSRSSTAADGATGLDVELGVPQNAGPGLSVPGPTASAGEIDSYVAAATAYWKSDAGRATAHLKDTVVTLPAGMSVNPSGATGLTSCSDDQIGVRGFDQEHGRLLFDNVDPFDGVGSPSAGDECLDGSKIGTVEVDTPLLADPLTGEMVLGDPKSTDPQSGEMFRLFLVLRLPERGVLAKIHGTATADPATGRLVARFVQNPELPFDSLKVRVKGGGHGMLANPRDCGPRDVVSTFTPWSAAHGAAGQSVTDTDSLAVDQNCANGFAPSLEAGMDTRVARGNGTFSFRFSRKDGEQYLRGLTAKLPQGLLASVKDVPLCTNAQADAGSCPAGSKIGIVDAKAGSGDPFVLEEKGEVFLTDGYKGGEYGLAVKVRPVAGPFRGAMELSPIIVRQAIHVDRTSAQVTAISDPFPLIHHGVPLRVREVTVLVNRAGFMLNPSDCAGKQVAADISSDQGATSSPSNGFQASGCSGLAFKPKLTLVLTGKKQVKTGKHPGIKAVVTQQGIPEAGIEKAEVRLPKSLALDVNNAQALCEFVDGTKPDLENHCPKGSIVGRARAVSPLLNDPLVGDVYFVKNVRIDPKTGNQIRTLPMIVVALRGEISVNLKGESDTQKGKLVNTFANVPDAPISQFNLNINGGSKGIIAVTRTRRSLINLCALGRQVAEADMDGQNGRRHDFDISMRKPCTKKQTKAAKRAAAKARKARRG